MSILTKLTNLFLSLLLVLQSIAPSIVAKAEEEVENSMISIDSHWKGTVFGDLGGQGNINADNFSIRELGENSVNMRVSNNRGKLSSSTDGISYYYTDIPSGADFDFSVTAEVLSFDANNQVAFGIMMRDVVFENINGNEFASHDHVSVGALDQRMKAFTRIDGVLSKNYELNATNINPAPGQIYNISARKIGKNVVVRVGDEEHTFSNLNESFKHIGLFVSRNAEVNYSNISLTVYEEDASRQLIDLDIDASQAQTDYLVNDQINLEGLQVIAKYSDGTEEILSANDYLVTGFNSSVPGMNTVTINFRNQTATLDLSIRSLEVDELHVSYLPARLTYYIGDSFNADGLVIEATYNNGAVKVLTPEQYDILVPEVFSKSGVQTVTVVSKEKPSETAEITIEVKEAALEGLRLSQQPQKKLYFLNDVLDLTGLVIYAEYSDGSHVRLLPQNYTVSELDTSSTGEKRVTITHKEAEINFEVSVKEREVQQLTIIDYPKTTYLQGESFDTDGLVIGLAYDNGDLDIIDSSKYIINAPELNEVGREVVIINIENNALEPIELPITVVGNHEMIWNDRVFGQSISANRNFVEVFEDGKIKLTALEGGGKVTGDHDGISFYYTELNAIEDNFELTATIEVEEYAKNPHDGQESFGIMARDDINDHLNSSVFASNIAAIGGYSGGTRNPNGIQLFARTGVLAPDGEGSEGLTSVMLQEENRPSGTYKFMLKKTNSGFIGRVNNGEEEILFEPDILSVMSDRMYVGFYAARLATIIVSDINIEVTKAMTDAPRVNPPAKPVTPNFSIESLNRTAEDNYDLRVHPNVDGTVTIRQGQEIIVSERPVTAGEDNVFNTQLFNAHTPFSITIYPDDTQYLTSYNPIVKNFSVEKRRYEGDIIVSPEGRSDGEGTVESPLDVDTAIDFVHPGQQIVLQGGEYKRTKPLEVKRHNNGEDGQMKYFVAADDVVFDFGLVSEGGILSGDYWHIKGIDFRNSAGNTKGFTVGGSHNIIELSQFYNNGDTGLQISRTNQSNDIEDWPSHNLLLNVTSFDNRDPSNNNADGFGAKLTSGEGNIFRGAIAYNNIDDGWDLYTKAGSGKIGAVIIEDSVAYNNGFVSYDDSHRGDGNGFKLGGEGIHVPHEIRNSLSFGNLTYGFTSNSNPGVIAENNIGFNNGSGNLSFTTYTHIPTDFAINGFVSFQNQYDAKDSYPKRHESDNNFFFDGEVSKNVSGITITEENFESLNFEGFERDENGDIIWGPFLRFISPVTAEDEQENQEDEEEQEDDEEQENIEGNVEDNNEDDKNEEVDDSKDNNGNQQDGTEDKGNDASEKVIKGVTTPKVESLKAGDRVIRGNATKETTVYAMSDGELLGATVVNSPFEIELSEALVEGMKIELYAEDSEGNRSESVFLTVESQTVHSSIDETDQTAGEENTVNSDGDSATGEKLPSTATGTYLILALGTVLTLFGGGLYLSNKKR